jgi:hypothetical protein
MRLIGNKLLKTNNVRDRIYWKERNIKMPSMRIWYKQDIHTRRLITSNNLMQRIYNEINRE